MAVQAGWVGSSAKAETGEAWMGDARVALRLPRAGWMSEMVGKSKEIHFVNNINQTQANIYELMGSPTEVTTYIFENNATISAATQGGWALVTGAFPAGSTLRIINRGHIRGGGGNGGRGGSRAYAGGAGGTALILNFPATIDNASGTIWGGGGGGGGGTGADSRGRVIGVGGGGGAGIPAGTGGGGSTLNGSNGSATAGGAGGNHTYAQAGNGGAAGAGGRGGFGGNGGRGGYSVQANGNAVSWIAVGDRRGAVV